MAFVPQTFLLIPDIHAKAGDSLERLRMLRAWLRRRKTPVDRIVSMGDVFDFESLCTHDQHTPEWYARSLKEDTAAGFRAIDMIMDIAKDLRIAPQYVHLITGNHDERYTKFMASDNRLQTSDFPKTFRSLLAKDMVNKGYKFHPFLKPLIANGAAFSHYFISGLMGRAIGGERPAANLLRSQFMTSIVGHSHILDLAERTRADGSKIYALASGCFVNPDDPFAYAGAARRLWWNGCHLLHFTKMSEFDLESISLDRM